MQEVELELAVVTSSVAVPLFSSVPLQLRQVRRGKTGYFLRRIIHDRLSLPSELNPDLGIELTKR